jgi:hypothetical protein
MAAFCCVGALAILGALEHVDADLLGWWLCERQLKSGGLNGRPEKLADVCADTYGVSDIVGGGARRGALMHQAAWCARCVTRGGYCRV